MAGPWERYSTAARTALTEGPWSKYGQPQAVGDEVRAEAKARVQQEKEAGLDHMPRFAEGLPFIGGLLDEATGLIQSGLHTVSGGRIGEPYEMGLELERERSRRADEENPAMAATGKIAAGLTGLAPVARGGDAILSGITRVATRNPAATVAPLQSMIRPAETVGGNIVKGVTTGASIGAVEGFTRGEGDAGNRLEAAGDTAKVGAGLGFAFPLIAAGASRAYGAAADLVEPTLTRWRSGPDAAAESILARKMHREGITPQDRIRDLDAGQDAARMGANSASTLPETIADTSPAMQRTLGSVYRAGGEAGTLTERTLQTRQRGPDNPYLRSTPNAAPDGQRARVLDTTERTLQIRGAQSALRTDQQIMRDQAREGRRLYDRAYESAEAFDLDPVIQGLALRAQQYPGPFAAQLQRAVNLFRQGGTGNNRPFWIDNIRRFDGSKKALDDMIDKAARAGSNNLVRELTQFKDELLSAVHGFDNAGNPTRNLPYLEARRAWGSAAENREAIEMGQAAFRDGSEIGVDNYRQLTPGQQTLFRIGINQSIRNALGRSKPGDDVTRLFQEPRVIELMREVIPRPAGRNAVFANRPERFGEVMRREQRMVQTRNRALGGSPTAERAQDDLELAGEVTRTLWDRVRQAPGLYNVTMEMVGAGMQRFFGYRQDVALAMARRMLEGDPVVQRQILNSLAQRGGPDAFDQFIRLVDEAALRITGGATPALADLTKGDR
jgi:hypothetical protein